MGDPRKLRKKYTKPSHPWQKQRIDEERVLMQEYGFKNKAELWKLNSKLRNFKTQVKQLVPRDDDLAEKQKLQLIKKLQRLNLLQDNAVLEDILSLTLKDLCERRLQTLVFKKGLSRSVKQARQFIVHDHIIIGDNKITSPSYVVSVEEESRIGFADNSALHSAEHPERVDQAAIVKMEKAEIGINRETPKQKPADKESAQKALEKDIKEEKAKEESK